MEFSLPLLSVDNFFNQSISQHSIMVEMFHLQCVFLLHQQFCHFSITHLQQPALASCQIANAKLNQKSFNKMNCHLASELITLQVLNSSLKEQLRLKMIIQIIRGFFFYVTITAVGKYTAFPYTSSEVGYGLSVSTHPCISSRCDNPKNLEKIQSLSVYCHISYI
jgi:hypothetical protein